jgi:hypothetical protein
MCPLPTTEEPVELPLERVGEGASSSAARAHVPRHARHQPPARFFAKVRLTAGFGGSELISDCVVAFRNHFFCKENVDNPVDVTR